MVKFDIISGFLGSGKTTLIRKILNSLDSREKVVLIENEFGDVSVDREVLEIEGFEIYEISNGCVCCKLKGDFIFTLKEILKQKIDRIIFEPSGIFVIGEIFDLFKDPEISSECYVNSVTTVVDAQNFSSHLHSYSAFFKSQICNASSLVVSKTQFLLAEEISQIELELHVLNETATILTKNWTELSNQELLGLIDKKTVITSNDIAHSLSHDFESIGLRTSRILSIEHLESILQKCKNGDYGTILRGKGFVKSDSGYLEFHYVDGHYSIIESSGVTTGIISFIGEDLEKEPLTAAFQ
ncbi:GTP-binding protein [Desulfosporosinus sp. OT]|uniref:CobW family GTP-binding protein n=1 Tax=Desulfosporosinus sp. OT TaxID=913865 RepID=UPI000223AD70|nr:GTP-binding protein [Desulfosporosinus sp. OT]EGW39666.1 cobW/HypB/UreG, nucleotide-binding domain protein [Desulfosporosinus sp. OT]